MASRGKKMTFGELLKSVTKTTQYQTFLTYKNLTNNHRTRLI